MRSIEWQEIDPEEVPGILAEINPKIEPTPFNPSSTTIRYKDVPFYPGYRFLEVVDHSSVPGVKKFVIYQEGDVNVISWTNATIYGVNEKAPIEITEENAPLYVKFFFDYVRGRHGRFIIVESASDISWSEEPPEQGLKAMNDMIKPLTKIDSQGDTLTMVAYMIFKDSLFKANVHVEKDGMVSLSDEQLVVEGLPVNPDTVVG